MPSVAIIDYGSGNLRSAAISFENVAGAKMPVKVTASPADLKSASHIVLPGVGAFGDCIRGLGALPGMREAMEEEVRGRKKWFLGICVGMQMLMERGHEHGVHEGLGWIEGEVVKLGIGHLAFGIKKAPPESLMPNAHSLKIPHMGWNELCFLRAHPLTAGIEQSSHAYFVHSYHAVCENAADILATTDYGQPVTAVIARDNIMGTQFHPEKSQETGLRLLRNFVEM